MHTITLLQNRVSYLALPHTKEKSGQTDICTASCSVMGMPAVIIVIIICRIQVYVCCIIGIDSGKLCRGEAVWEWRGSCHWLVARET